ncbi:lactate racemase domain-containing protein [Candidatus Hecatella orcuttiae]|uniref:lactate racemase domain-containing protein n=1 Tax=Candidatus Hecatella orcuttiae TaxID=1935119 RepID=UPI002867F7BE|nr:lactate racemase domain-containing protein [Candidatus Hecatella orcuttiae]
MNGKSYEVPALAWFGREKLELRFPENWHVEFLPMNGYARASVGEGEVKRALKEPWACKPLEKLAEGRGEAVIVVDDLTRPTRAYEIVPHVLEELKKAGISDERIRFIMGLGLHGARCRYDFAKKLGEEIVQRYPVYNHNPFANCERVGETSWGTQLEINAEYLSCDLRIGIGCVTPHPMTGYGGGAKMILPGLASYAAVYHNHVNLCRRMGAVDRRNLWGILKGNTVREDIEEAANLAAMDMKIDVLVNGFGGSAQIFAGNVHETFKQAVEAAKEHYSTRFEGKFDVVVANTYAKANEATLALSNWKHAVKKNGVMVIIAQTPEGQVTHYLYGMFGKKETAPGAGAPSRPEFGRLIVFSQYKTPHPLLPVGDPSSTLWLNSWEEVLEEIKASCPLNPRVAILPNAEIQCAEEKLKRP